MVLENRFVVVWDKRWMEGEIIKGYGKIFVGDEMF